jgi:hypothetical protein
VQHSDAAVTASTDSSCVHLMSLNLVRTAYLAKKLCDSPSGSYKLYRRRHYWMAGMSACAPQKISSCKHN